MLWLSLERPPLIIAWEEKPSLNILESAEAPDGQSEKLPGLIQRAKCVLTKCETFCQTSTGQQGPGKRRRLVCSDTVGHHNLCQPILYTL